MLYNKLKKQLSCLKNDRNLTHPEDDVLKAYIQGQIDRLLLIMPEVFKMEERMNNALRETERV